MHTEAYLAFGELAGLAGLDLGEQMTVLDVGGSDNNGTVHNYFTNPDTKIVTLDIDGNSDITADARYWRPTTELFDVVIATELFEHVDGWALVIETMQCALDPDGLGVYLSTCASTGRQSHGSNGAPKPERGEWYRNVDPGELLRVLQGLFSDCDVRYAYPPGDAYAWARL